MGNRLTQRRHVRYLAEGIFWGVAALLFGVAFRGAFGDGHLVAAFGEALLAFASMCCALACWRKSDRRWY